MDANGHHSPWSIVSEAFESRGCVLLSMSVDVSYQVRLYTLQLPTVFFSLLLGCSGVSGISCGFWLPLSLQTPGIIFLRQFAGSVACSLHLLSIAPGSSPVLTEVHTMKIVAHTLSIFGCFMMGESHLSLHLVWVFVVVLFVCLFGGGFFCVCFCFFFFKFFCSKVWSKGVVRINCWVHHIHKLRFFFWENFETTWLWYFPFVFGAFSLKHSEEEWQGPGVLDHVNYPHGCSWLDGFLLEVLLKARGYQQQPVGSLPVTAWGFWDKPGRGLTFCLWLPANHRGRMEKVSPARSVYHLARLLLLC